MIETRVIRLHKTGGPEVLVEETIPLDLPGPGEVIVRNTAIGLNFIDTYFRSGLYPAALPFIPGNEGAGIVDQVGAEVTHLKPGDRVAYLSAGAYASHTKVVASSVVKLPDSIAYDQAAAVLLKGLTAWMLLFEVRRARPGETALVWAAAGGVGSLLVPWARSLGVRVIAVVSTEEKAARVRANGAEDVLLSHEDIPARVHELTAGRGVDVSYDSVGKDSADASLAALRPRGWFVTYGNASGPVAPIAPARLSMGGSLNMTRPTLFSFISTPQEMAAGTAALFGALQVGTLKADIGHRVPLAKVAEAHKAIEARQTMGSTVLIP
ncbi:MAG: quinone oxidoreductase [Pseudomonadota bacterium]